MKKSIIDTYTTFYFVDIVVANKYTTITLLKKLYTFSDGTELNDDILNGIATTSCCTRKSDNKDVVLIKHNRDNTIKGIDKKVDMINTIIHESCHATMDIYYHMRQDIHDCSQEPFCYLAGYIAECMYKTLAKK